MITHKEAGKEIVDRFIVTLGENIVIESSPKMEGRSLIAIIAPAEKK
jgi:translation initiation factor IF-3